MDGVRYGGQEMNRWKKGVWVDGWRERRFGEKKGKGAGGKNGWMGEKWWIGREKGRARKGLMDGWMDRQVYR